MSEPIQNQRQQSDMEGAKEDHVETHTLSENQKDTERSMVLYDASMAALAPPQKVTPTTFHKFNDLPRELRDEIYYLALPQRRIFYITAYPLKGHVSHKRCPNAPISTPLLHTSNETRQFAQRYYTIDNIHSETRKGPAIYIDRKVDFLHIEAMDWFRWQLPSYWIHDKWTKNIRNLVCDWARAFHNEEWVEMLLHIRQLLGYFPQLRTLVWCYWYANFGVIGTKFPRELFGNSLGSYVRGAKGEESRGESVKCDIKFMFCQCLVWGELTGTLDQALDQLSMGREPHVMYSVTV